MQVWKHDVEDKSLCCLIIIIIGNFFFSKAMDSIIPFRIGSEL